MLVRKRRALAGHLARPLHLGGRCGRPLLIVPRVGAGAGVKLPGIGEEGLELRVGHFFKLFVPCPYGTVA